jgi:hypothetical protein
MARWLAGFSIALGLAACGAEGSATDAGPAEAGRGSDGGSAGGYLGSSFGIFGAFAPEYSYFTAKMGYTDDQYWSWVERHFKTLGAHWTRSNLQLFWDIVEPTLGAGYSWSNAMNSDRIVTRMYAEGNAVNWVGVFHEGGQRQGSTKPAARNPVDYPAEYQAFVRAAVERYDGDGKDDAAQGVRVKYWQAGNELEGWIRAGRTVADYIKYVKLIREAARAADPEAKIVLIAPTDGMQADSTLTQIIDGLAPDKAFDAIDVHHWRPALEYKMSAVAAYRKQLDARGLSSVEIFSCEHGTWQGQPQGRSGAEPLQSEQDQARSLVRRFVYNLNNGLDKLFWNNLMEWNRFAGNAGSMFNSMGLVTDGQGQGEDPARFNTERVAYFSYKMLAERIDTHVAKKRGAMGEADQNAGVYGYAYERLSDGKKRYIVWSDTGTVSLTFAIGSPTAELVNLIPDRHGEVLERKQLVASGGKVTVSVGLDPLVIEES